MVFVLAGIIGDIWRDSCPDFITCFLNLLPKEKVELKCGKFLRGINLCYLVQFAEKCIAGLKIQFYFWTGAAFFYLLMFETGKCCNLEKVKSSWSALHHLPDSACCRAGCKLFPVFKLHILHNWSRREYDLLSRKRICTSFKYGYSNWPGEAIWDTHDRGLTLCCPAMSLNTLQASSLLTTFGIDVNQAILHKDIRVASTILSDLVPNAPALIKCPCTGACIEKPDKNDRIWLHVLLHLLKEFQCLVPFLIVGVPESWHLRILLTCWTLATHDACFYT